MNDPRLWLLLRHSLRLNWRSPSGNLHSFFETSKILGLLGLSVLALWAYRGFPGRQDLLLPHVLPKEILGVTGLCIYYFLFLGSLGHEMLVTSLRQDPHYEFLYNTPLSNRTLLTSYLINGWIIQFLPLHLILLPVSLGCAVYFRSPALLGGIHLALLCTMVIGGCLSLWSVYVVLQWQRKQKLWNFTQSLTQIVFCCMGIAIVATIGILPVLYQSGFISNQTFLAWLDFWGSWFNLERWIQEENWVRQSGRIIVLDPLPTLGFVVASIGVLGFTLPVLPDRLFTTLKGFPTTTRPKTKSPKTVQGQQRPFQTNLNSLLVQREWRRFRVHWFRLLLSAISCVGLPYYVLLAPRSDQAAPDMPLFMATFATALWPALAGWLCGSIVFGDEDSVALLKSAPINLNQVRWCKRLAVLIPLWVAFTPLILIIRLMGLPWGWSAIFILVGPICQVMRCSWNTWPLPSIRSYLGLPHNSVVSMVTRDRWLRWGQWLSIGCWAGGPFLIFYGQLMWGLLVLSLDGCLMALAYRRYQHIGDIWSF